MNYSYLLSFFTLKKESNAYYPPRCFKKTFVGVHRKGIVYIRPTWGATSICMRPLILNKTTASLFFPFLLLLFSQTKRPIEYSSLQWITTNRMITIRMKQKRWVQQKKNNHASVPLTLSATNWTSKSNIFCYSRNIRYTCLIDRTSGKIFWYRSNLRRICPNKNVDVN